MFVKSKRIPMIYDYFNMLGMSNAKNTYSAWCEVLKLSERFWQKKITKLSCHI